MQSARLLHLGKESYTEMGYGQHMMKWPDKKWTIGIVVSVAGIVVSAAVAIYFNSPSHNSLTNVANTGNITQGRDIVVNNLPRQYFSDTQRVIWAPDFLGGHKTLNLDNAATLTARVALSGSIIMVLDDVAVPVIRGSNLFKLSTSNNPQYVFDGKQIRHEIQVGGRTFVVKLKEINNLKIPEVANPVEYVFGISEK